MFILGNQLAHDSSIKNVGLTQNDWSHLSISVGLIHQRFWGYIHFSRTWGVFFQKIESFPRDFGGLRQVRQLQPPVFQAQASSFSNGRMRFVYTAGRPPRELNLQSGNDLSNAQKKAFWTTFGGWFFVIHFN